MGDGRVVIAGGSGLIGTALAGELVAAGREVVVLSRDPASVAPPAGARAVAWDGRTAGPWTAELEAALAVVNLAGAGIADRRWTAERKRRLRSSRLEPTAALVAAIAAARTPPRTLVQASGVGFYGDRGDEPVTEETGPGSGFMPELARAWEAASDPVVERRVRRVVVRSGIVLAREGGALPKMARPFRLGLGARLGSGRQWFPWIHVADEVGAIRFLIDDPRASGPFNLVAPEPATNAAFSRALARTLRRPLLLAVPSPALRLLFGEVAGELLEGQRAAPRRLLAAGYRFGFPEVGGALADLLAF
jgi:uncharacterized protein (TIGR01777 family)